MRPGEPGKRKRKRRGCIWAQLKRVLRIEKYSPLILLVKIDVCYFSGFPKLSHDQFICMGINSCNRAIFCGEFIKAKALSRPAASASRLIVQVSRRLFKPCKQKQLSAAGS